MLRIKEILNLLNSTYPLASQEEALIKGETQCLGIVL